MRKLILVVSLAVVTAGLLTCSVNDNPYLDRSKCSISIARQHMTGDTINIFAPEKFTVNLLLQAHITQFAFYADHNYEWTPGDTTIPHSQFGSDYSFQFSVAFYDTGVKVIRATAQLDNGDSITDTLRLHCVSPLDQPDVIGQVGQTVNLKTTPVAETNALYIWKFGANDSTQSEQATQTWYVDRVTSATGQLYVRLFGQTVRSPAQPFKISILDKTPPSIICINTKVSADGKHVSSPYPPFYFKVKIHDDASGLKQALVDNKAFDQIDTIDNKTWICNKEYFKIAPAGDSLGVTVTARDVPDNQASVQFWIVYDSTLVVKPELEIIDPASDSLRVPNRNFTVRGSAVDIEGHDSLFVLSEVNGGNGQPPQRITPAAPDWVSVCTLTKDTNSLRFALCDKTGPSSYDTLDIKALTVIFDSSVRDTTPPEIDSVFANGKLIVNGFMSDQTPLPLTVRPFDQSRITSVTFNGIAAINQGGNTWTGSVALSHVSAGDSIKIAAIDSAGNTGNATRLIYLNHPPIITLMPTLAYATVGKLYVDSVQAKDADGDPFTITVRIDTLIFTPNANGLFTWTPAPGDTGNIKALVQVSDGYPQGADSSYTIIVGKPATIHKARFTIGASDFPETLVVGKTWVDTMRINMPPDSGHYIFNVQLVGSGDYLLKDSTDSVVRWTPTSQQIGAQYLRVIVNSSSDVADSIVPQPRIVVVAPQPYEVKFAKGASIAYEGTSPHIIAVVLNRPSDGAVSIGYKVLGNLTSGDSTDFQLPVPPQVTFLKGDTIAHIPVTIIDDTIPKKNIHAVFALTNQIPADMVITTPSTHTMAIVDNDTAKGSDTVSIVTRDTFGIKASYSVPITIRANSPVQKDMEFHILHSGSALYGSALDYTIDSLDFTMTHGQIEKVVNIIINQNNVCEPVTVFIFVTLQSLTSGVVMQDSSFIYGILPNNTSYCNKIVAFIYGGKTPSPLESAVIDTIATQGYTVYPLRREDVKYANIMAFNEIILSGSLTDGKLGDSLSRFAVPVLSASLMNSVTLGLTSGATTDTGWARESQIDVSAGIPQQWVRTPITQAPSLIPWAHPITSAQVVARLPIATGGTGGPIIADTSRAVIFHVVSSVSSGPSMTQARRCVFPICKPTVGTDVVAYTQGWWDLLKSAVDWTASGMTVTPLSRAASQ